MVTQWTGSRFTSVNKAPRITEASWPKTKEKQRSALMACSSEVKNTVTGKTRKDGRRRSGYAGRQSVMPGIVFDVTLPKWLVSTLSWLSVHVLRLPTYSNSARYMSSQRLLRTRRWINKLYFLKITERIDWLKRYASRAIQFYTFSIAKRSYDYIQMQKALKMIL